MLVTYCNSLYQAVTLWICGMREGIAYKNQRYLLTDILGQLRDNSTAPWHSLIDPVTPMSGCFK